MKQKIRLTEGDLHRIVKESVKRVLRESNEMRQVQVVAYPYATIIGTIQVPSNLTNQEEVERYVSDNFDDVAFGSPELDFGGTDFDVNF